MEETFETQLSDLIVVWQDRGTSQEDIIAALTAALREQDMDSED